MVREQDACKPRKVTQFKVVFTSKGDLCDKTYAHLHNSSDYVWEDNKIFSDTLEYDSFFGCTSGNSRIVFVSLSTGRRYGMFMSDFDEALKAKKFTDNKLIGNFCFCKKSSAQGVRLLLEAL